MRFQISGKQIDIGMSLQTYVQDELNSAVKKYAERPVDANVVFSKSGPEFVCEATVHLSTGLTARAKGKAHDIHASFDTMTATLEKQLRRYKRRLKDHYLSNSEPVDHFSASFCITALYHE